MTVRRVSIGLLILGSLASFALAQGGSVGGISPSAFPNQLVVANLPAADGTQGMRIVTDGASSSDCSSGGGSSIVVCLDTGSWTVVGAGGGGSIGGSTGATDNALLRADGTGGSTIQSSSVTISDTGTLTVPSQSTVAHTAGSIYFDTEDDAFVAYNSESEIALQVGLESWVEVFNDSGAPITNGSVVYASGADLTTGLLEIGLARADAESTSRVLGLATHDIEDGTVGFITQFGEVNGINTSAFAVSQPVWLSEITPGGLTGTPPESPNRSVFVGYVSVSDATVGTVFVTTIGNTGAPAGEASEIVIPVRKGSVGTISKGQVVYITGYNSGQGVVEVELADASSAATMPAAGIASDEITNSATGGMTVSGRIVGFDTSSFTVGSQLYVSETPGALTATKPTGTALVQKIAEVLRSHLSLGAVMVIGAGRSNDLPNLASGNTWVGDGSGVPAEQAFAHASAHSDGGTDEVTAENLATSCTDGQILEAMTGGWVCGADDAGGAATSIDADGDGTDEVWSDGTWIYFDSDDNGVYNQRIAGTSFEVQSIFRIVTEGTTAESLEINSISNAVSAIDGGGFTRASLMLETPSATNPTLVPDFNRQTTGVGLTAGTDTGALISASATAVQWTSQATTIYRTTRHEPEATAPASCSLGDVYIDTSGAFCACNTSAAWELVHDLSDGGSPNCT